ncbi:MAG TPA: cell division protein, partial [Methanocorpusculum sp.]|nr:cell division protein [Methanocorpusculum sp.]
LSTLVNEADNVIVFDNSAWKNDGESVKSAYERLNEEIVRRFGVLFRAGEVGKYGVGEMVVDSSEIINTLRGGGISSVGYAISEAIPVAKGGGKPSSKKDSNGGLLSSILGKKEKKAEPHVDIASGEDKSAKIIGLVRRAMLGRLTLPCDYSTAERALVLVAGPPTELDRKGVEKSKSWVEENIAGVEVRGGDYPVDSGYVAAVVLLASIGEAPRIRELMELAKEAKEEVVRSRERSHTVMFDDGIDPLFE